MRVKASDVVAIIDEGVGNSTLVEVLENILSEEEISVQRTGEPRSVVLYEVDGEACVYVGNTAGSTLKAHVEKEGFIFI